MTPNQVDYMFPFFVFFYGFLILLVLEAFPVLLRRLEGRESAALAWFQRIEQRKPFAWLCFFIGGLWSLQNIWLS